MSLHYNYLITNTPVSFSSSLYVLLTFDAFDLLDLSVCQIPHDRQLIIALCTLRFGTSTGISENIRSHARARMDAFFIKIKESTVVHRSASADKCWYIAHLSVNPLPPGVKKSNMRIAALNLR